MSRLNSREVDQLLSELASLGRAGIPLPQGLRELSGAMPGGRLQAVVAELAAATESGKPLSDSLAAASHPIPVEIVEMIRCAELAGGLSTGLQAILGQLRRIQKHRAALFTAAVYPAVVVLTAILVLYLVSNSILPNIYLALGALNSNVPMPLMTSYTLTSIFRGTAGIIFAIGSAAVVLFVMWAPAVRDFLFRVYIRLPGLRPLICLGDTAVMMRFLSVMLSRGVPLPDALRAIEPAMWHRSMQRGAAEMANAATSGQPVAPFLSGTVPSTAGFIFHQAEQHGDLPAACEHIASYCEERFDILSKRALAFIEPLLILFVAIFIGLCVFLLYLPLFQIPRMVMM